MVYAKKMGKQGVKEHVVFFLQSDCYLFSIFAMAP